MPSPEMPHYESIADFNYERVKYRKEGISNTYLSENNNIPNRVQSKSNSRSKVHSKTNNTTENSSKKIF